MLSNLALLYEAPILSVQLIIDGILIGAILSLAAYGMALGMNGDASDTGLEKSAETLLAARPTAVNLRWAVDQMQTLLSPLDADKRA